MNTQIKKEYKEVQPCFTSFTIAGKDGETPSFDTRERLSTSLAGMVLIRIWS